MPLLLASLILPALLTWLLGDVFSLHDEDQFILFVGLFVATFVGSIAISQLMEHGQRYQRNQQAQEIKPLQQLKETLLRHRLGAINALAILACAIYWFTRSTAPVSVPQISPQLAKADVAVASTTPVDKPALVLKLVQSTVVVF